MVIIGNLKAWFGSKACSPVFGGDLFYSIKFAFYTSIFFAVEATDFIYAFILW